MHSLMPTHSAGQQLSCGSTLSGAAFAPGVCMNTTTSLVGLEQSTIGEGDSIHQTFCPFFYFHKYFL